MTSPAVVQGIIGLDVNAVYTTGTSTAGVGSPYKLGTRVFDTAGNEYMLVQAAANLLTNTTDPNALSISSTFQASLMTTALAKTGELGFAPQAVIASTNFFWARVGGTFNMRVAASAAATTYLRTTVTAGRLGTASTASAVVFTGAMILTAASASTSAGNSVRSGLVLKGHAVRSGASTFVN